MNTGLVTVNAAVMGAIAAMKHTASEKRLSGWISLKITWDGNKFEASQGMGQTPEPEELRTVTDQVGVFNLEVGFFSKLQNHLDDVEIAKIGLAVIIDHLKVKV